MGSPVDIIGRRLVNQRLAGSNARSGADIVAWMGAVQAQDYPGARWALGMRVPRVADADIEREFERGAILRTHVLRPTWHFVAPADIRWLQALTGPRVRQAIAYYGRQLGVDAAVVRRSLSAIERALRGSRHLTRTELASALKRARIEASGQRLAYIVMEAEITALICSGPRRGNQFTYALIDERVPPAPARDRETALAELVRRYFTSHGPATVRDFVWWSGLTVRETKAGLAMLGSSVEMFAIDGSEYWLVPGRNGPRPASPDVHLLPNYDEFGIAYKDRDAFDPLPRPRGMRGWTEYPHLLVIDGLLAGSWRRVPGGGALSVEVQRFRALSRAETKAIHAAGERLAAFVGHPVTTTVR